MARKKNKETLHRLNESVMILEQQLEGQKKQQERIISAEIKSRFVPTWPLPVVPSVTSVCNG